MTMMMRRITCKCVYQQRASLVCKENQSENFYALHGIITDYDYYHERPRLHLPTTSAITMCAPSIPLS